MHNGERLREAAIENINRKIAIMVAWLDSNKIPPRVDLNSEIERDKDGEIALEWFPRSIHQFSLWNGTQNSHQFQNKFSLKPTGRNTLDKYKDQKEVIQKLILSLSALEDDQKLKNNKTSRLRQLEGLLKVERLKKEVAQTTYLTLFKKHMEIEEMLRTEKLAHKRNVEILSQDLEVSKAKVAELTRIVSKLESFSIFKSTTQENG